MKVLRNNPKGVEVELRYNEDKGKTWVAVIDPQTKKIVEFVQGRYGEGTMMNVKLGWRKVEGTKKYWLEKGKLYRIHEINEDKIYNPDNETQAGEPEPVQVPINVVTEKENYVEVELRYNDFKGKTWVARVDPNSHEIIMWEDGKYTDESYGRTGKVAPRGRKRYWLKRGQTYLLHEIDREYIYTPEVKG